MTPARVRRASPPVVGSARQDDHDEQVPLLGRRAELATLTEALRAGLEGSCTLVLVEGLTGVGKSRVLREALRAVAPHIPTGWARCSRLSAEVPYFPLADALRDALGAAPLHPPPVPGLEAVFPELDAPRTPPAAAASHPFEALLGLLRRQAPLVLVLDDLQWADPLSLAALHYLRQRGADLPVALIGAYRSEDVGPRHPLRQMDAHVRVPLSPLTPAEFVPLAVPGLHALTGGYPAYLPAALAPRCDHDGFSDDGLAEEVLARAHEAGPVAARLLIACSTLSSSFPPETAALLTGLDPLVAAEQLEVLCARGLLHLDGDGFDFCSTLVREVLAGQVSPSRRRLLVERSQSVIVLDAASGAFSPLRVERVG